MARGGSKPGERRGGRQKGTPNKLNKRVCSGLLAVLASMLLADIADQSLPARIDVPVLASSRVTDTCILALGSLVF